MNMGDEKDLTIMRLRIERDETAERLEIAVRALKRIVECDHAAARAEAHYALAAIPVVTGPDVGERGSQILDKEARELRARLAEVTRERDEARAERDETQREVQLLRAVVSASLHGGNNGQDLANAYAALRRFDASRRGAP